jgi:serine phosphatase RsbU (regulator of sigma subunit)
VDFELGDVVAVVTDGVTEATAAGEREFGDDCVCQVLLRQPGGSAAVVLQVFVAVVDDWVGAAGCYDDLTVFVLRG